MSSHDLDGGNDDRGNYLASSGLTKVLFHEKGAGCIYRIWTTNQASSTDYTPTAHGDIRIYVDGNLIVNTTMAAFFSGSYSTFTYPLTASWGKSSGGFISYLPIPYRSECKVEWTAPATTTPLLYYNIDYIKYDNDQGVTSFTGAEDTGSVLNKWTSPGVDPKPTPVSSTLTGSVTVLRSGGTAVVADIPGPGCIARVRLKVPSSSLWYEWTNAKVLITFDGHSSPDIAAPYGHFFGGDIVRPAPGNIETYENFDGSIRGLLFGTDFSTGWNYNYLPMPFGSRAKVEIQNNNPYSDMRFDYEISLSSMPDAARLLASGQVGYLKSTQNLNNVPRTPGQDYKLLDLSGRGVVVGYIYTPYGGTNGSKSYLEGDERIYTDNSLTPAIYGTGTEDIFSGGWYFKQGRFSLPVHGYTVQTTGPDGRSVYRMLTGDTIPFNSRINFGFECGPQNGDSGTDERTNLSGACMNATLYYYWSPAGPTLTLTDVFDPGNTTSETSHGYTKTGATTTNPISRTLKYEGDNDTVTSSDSGWHLMNGESQFTLSIRPDNYGVKLRRLSYYSVANQQAQVFVNDQPVGAWYDAGSNPILSWKDSQFLIPAAFTQGKSSIRVRIVSTGEWTEYKYQALTFVSPQTTPPSPSVTDDGAYTASPTSIHFSWTRPDEPVWGINEYSYSIGTTPGGTDVRGWTGCGDVLSFIAPDLELQNGKTYYVSIRAKNGAGIWSASGVSDGISTPYTSLSSLKQLADNEGAGITGCVVTAVYNGCFYVEDADRVSGIRVDSSTSVSQGDRVFVEGKLSTVNGERRLVASRVVKM